MNEKFKKYVRATAELEKEYKELEKNIKERKAKILKYLQEKQIYQLNTQYTRVTKVETVRESVNSEKAKKELPIDKLKQIFKEVKHIEFDNVAASEILTGKERTSIMDIKKSSFIKISTLKTADESVITDSDKKK